MSAMDCLDYCVYLARTFQGVSVNRGLNSDSRRQIITPHIETQTPPFIDGTISKSCNNCFTWALSDKIHDCSENSHPMIKACNL
jgi:hypothetical protein